MNFDRLNRWLTLGANVGVLLGLGALIVEINQSNALATAELEQARSDGLREWRQEWAANEFIVPMLLRAFSIVNPNSAEYLSLNVHEKQEAISSMLAELDPEDAMRFRLWVTADYWDYENLFAQYGRGLISEEYWLERGIGGVLSRAPMWKAAVGGGLLFGREAFNEEVERLLRVCPSGLRSECSTQDLR